MTRREELQQAAQDRGLDMVIDLYIPQATPGLLALVQHAMAHMNDAGLFFAPQNKLVSKYNVTPGQIKHGRRIMLCMNMLKECSRRFQQSTWYELTLPREWTIETAPNRLPEPQPTTSTKRTISRQQLLDYLAKRFSDIPSQDQIDSDITKWASKGHRLTTQQIEKCIFYKKDVTYKQLMTPHRPVVGGEIPGWKYLITENDVEKANDARQVPAKLAIALWKKRKLPLRDERATLSRIEDKAYYLFRDQGKSEYLKTLNAAFKHRAANSWSLDHLACQTLDWLFQDKNDILNIENAAAGNYNNWNKTSKSIADGELDNEINWDAIRDASNK